MLVGRFGLYKCICGGFDINFFNGEYFVVDKDRDGIANEFYWSIRDRLSLNVLNVFTCLYKDQQI
jgi:hypothetical protein